MEEGTTFPVQRKKKSTKKYPGFVRNLGNYITEYTENSSLHGVRYLGETKRNIFERLWWLIVFVVSLYVCVDLILKTYHKWDSSPVIVSFAQSPTPVWQIPFPAVTICPETKARQSVFNFTDCYNRQLDLNLTMDELKQYQKVSLVCDNHLYTEGNETTDYSTIDFLAEIAPPFSQVFWTCMWTNHNHTCDTLFTPVLTEEGVCYTFNMLDRDDIFTNEVYHNKEFLHHNFDRHGWTLEDGYAKDAGKDTFPNRAMSSGQSAGMSMLLRAFDYDLDYICKGPVQGFKILLHHPGEVPRVSTQYFRAPLNQEVIVNVKPDMMTTSDSLRDYDPHRRKCYFSTERELRFYQNYTQQNCEVECLTNFTYNYCGCVAYHMPHDESTPICASGKQFCMHEARSELLAKQVTTGLEKQNAGDSATPQANIECDCLPACTSLTYNAEMSQADFNWPAVFQAFRSNVSEFPGVQITRLTIFFKEMQFITSTRNELYGLTDFLANCGGLLGLFIGFSFLSAVETLYFLTFRLWCNMRRHGRHYWSGSPNLITSDKYDYNK